MTTPILSESDVQILLAISKHYTEEAKLAYASSLTKLLVETARAKQIRSRFQESLQSGVSTKFLLYQLNTTDTFRSITIDIEALFNFYNIIGELEQACGKYVQSTYGLEDSKINIFLEFVPPAITSQKAEPFTDPIWDRRLEKETSW